VVDWESGSCVVCPDCGPDGYCRLDGKQTRCRCSHGYTGDTCDDCAAGYSRRGSGADCRWEPFCHFGALNHVTDECVCDDPGRDPDTHCALCRPTHTLTIGNRCVPCGGEDDDDSWDCGPHGRCDGHQRCWCDSTEGYAFVRARATCVPCDYRAGATTPPDQGCKRCPRSCPENAACGVDADDPDAEDAVCVCRPGYVSEGGEQRCVFSMLSATRVAFLNLFDLDALVAVDAFDAVGLPKVQSGAVPAPTYSVADTGLPLIGVLSAVASAGATAVLLFRRIARRAAELGN
jgi:hypothetical protein